MFYLSRTVAVAESTDLNLIVRLTRNASISVPPAGVLNINTGVLILCDSNSSLAVTNAGTIFLNPAPVNSGRIYFEPFNTITPNRGSPISSIYSRLRVLGVVNQLPSIPDRVGGRTVVTVGSTGTNIPLLSLSTNESFLGDIVVHLANSSLVGTPNSGPTKVTLAATYGSSTTSNWSFAVFDETVGNPQGQLNVLSATNVSFAPKFFKSPDGQVSENLYVDGVSCSDLSVYYDGVEPPPNQYYCTICLANSSCNYCGNGQCVEFGECGSESVYTDCCGPQGTCASYETCQSSEGGTQYTCASTVICSWFLQNPDKNCNIISSDGVIVLAAVIVAIVTIVGLVSYIHFAANQKSKILHELRENLLSPSALARKGPNDSSVPREVHHQLVTHTHIHHPERICFHLYNGMFSLIGAVH